MKEKLKKGEIHKGYYNYVGCQMIEFCYYLIHCEYISFFSEHLYFNCTVIGPTFMSSLYIKKKLETV